ncbi:DsbA family protein [Sphingomonas sanxanigenens]|uniref:Thioredoxin-like fold domain-containing protein n=1 Tax=Sphingomonas sanxanigenens DSM 19645 = NX02 TaxID=1123269 RepID=W0AJF7_9SPHN|nr:thioredoxin domain-containing protein [Sphingomonas sanxanigenens]AHE56428.1 hypothetical protein NX02_24100 [Sphingomonas sanxanigenens DSM 19645 = NX02]
MRITTVLALSLSIALAACGGSEGGNTSAGADGPKVAATPAPAGQDWTTTVVKTPEGGFRMGNPNAPIKLVEFGSMTCSHCADFATTGIPALKRDYIATGKVSLEYRNFVRDSFDLTASLIARCGGEAPFFALTEQMFATQAEWIGRAQSPEAEQALRGAAGPALLPALAKASGLDQFARQRGVSADKIAACLKDQAEAERLAKGVETASEKYNITGTPSFLINDELVPNAAAWPQLEPALKAAGA